MNHPAIITIATGTELMLGQTLDRDFNFIARQVADLGYVIRRHYMVGDDVEELETVLSEALKIGDIVFLTGGLGPTTDDLTRNIVSKVLQRPLELRNDLLEGVQKKFRARGLEFPECARNQALILEGATAIPNDVGTAPGMHILIQEGAKHLFLLPGPPYELIPMFTNDIVPKLRTILPPKPIQFFTVRTFGIPESSVQGLMIEYFKHDPDFLESIGYCAGMHGVDVRLALKKEEEARLRPYQEKIMEVLKPWTYGIGNDPLHEVVAQLLISKRRTIAIAESCTGGLFCERLTQVPGISASFRLGLVAYANEAKEEMLGVSRESLRRHGAVSEAVALEMAEGVRRKGKADFGFSITGIAGPEGGTKEKPLGLVWIGLSGEGFSQAKSYQFSGNREVIQFKATQAAFFLLLCHLEELISVIPRKPMKSTGEGSKRSFE